MEIIEDFEQRAIRSVKRGIEILSENMSIKNKFTHVGKMVMIGNDQYVIEVYDKQEDQYFINMCLEDRIKNKKVLLFTSGWVNGNMFRNRMIGGYITIV
ncbi:hypothetical protein ELBI_20 [Anabaena phage Elbi]|nr:hypothetical protein ELBI_20 [Anabaena phage Elbi]